MSTMTAQIVVGRSHMYEGGINPTHQLWLSENGRSAWKLDLQSTSVVWVCTLENMLEDALALIMLHVIQDEESCAKAKELLGWNEEPHVELYAYPEEARKHLYAYVEKRYHELKLDLKLVLNILQGSSMKKCWKRLRSYPFEVEVTMSQFERSWDAFSNRMVTREGVDVK